MLHPISQLAQDLIRNINRVLCDEVNAHTLRAYEPHNLLHFVSNDIRKIRKKQMRLIEKEDETRLLRIANLWKFLEEFRQQPQQEGGIELWRCNELVRGEDVDHTMAICIRLQQIIKIQRGLAEKLISALLFESKQAALNRSNARRRNVAILHLQVLGVLPDKLQHRLQILKVEQQQSLIVGDLENQREHTALRVIETQQPCKQQRAHLGNRSSYRMPLLAEDIPERDRASCE